MECPISLFGDERMTKQTRLRQLLASGKKKFKETRYADAFTDFFEAAEIDNKNSEIYYFLGITCVRLENYGKAIGYFQKVLDSELAYINRVHTEMILGYVYTIDDEFEKALDCFRRIVEAGFENAQAYAAIGYIMYRLGNVKEAIMNLYRALDIDPNNANAHNSLGYILAESGINLSEALTECKKAVSLDKNNAAYLDSLGWIYYKLGKLSQARHYLKRAYEKAPSCEEIRRHLEVAIQHDNSK